MSPTTTWTYDYKLKTIYGDDILKSSKYHHGESHFYLMPDGGLVPCVTIDLPHQVPPWVGYAVSSISVKEALPCPACPARMTNLLLHWLAWGMLSGSTKLEWMLALCSLRLHSSLADPGCMPQASQWSSKFVILAGQAGQSNGSLAEILVVIHPKGGYQLVSYLIWLVILNTLHYSLLGSDSNLPLHPIAAKMHRRRMQKQ